MKKRALLSVYDKTDIVKLAKFLQDDDWQIVSTGGTGKLLQENGVDIIQIEEVTNNPEAFGGRMKTISFNVESAILFDREKDADEAKKLGIVPIDLVVCNLYPFEKVLNENANLDTLVENIDIGGPTMIRAAAKNYKYVTVLTDFNDYDKFMEKYKSGGIDEEFRFSMMRKAFNYTALYDILIANTMNRGYENDYLLMAFYKKQNLRYGENPHQKAFYYKDRYSYQSLYNFNQLQGKEISFNNFLDIKAAVEAILPFDKPACSIVKHNNPCGLAVSDSLQKAFELAWQGDSVSAFGSIIAFNRSVDLETVKFLNLHDKKHKKFVEVIIAPQFNQDAKEYLSQSKNLRVIEFDFKNAKSDFDIRYLNGLLLWQEKDNKLYDDLRLVTNSSFNLDKESDLIAFGINAVKNIKSNAIVLVRRVENSKQLLGMGAGQPNRIVATKLAIQKAIENIADIYYGDDFDTHLQDVFKETILISDAFFPFADSVEYAAEFGIKKIVQPGGSIKDKKVIQRANELGVSMIFTGIRHFKH